MSIKTSFRANAHLLKLLGDELIGDDRLAVFELVKNAYDADATQVDVELNLSDKNPNIVVWDLDGHGMSQDIILNKWMEIGTESKRNKNWIRSEKFNRLPLGEKGVGRLAVHKLGSLMQINTRAKGFPEVRLIIDWPDLIGRATYIEDTSVIIDELDTPEYFPNEDTGTRIIISNLSKNEWTRGDIRKLKRLLTSLISPFESLSDFKVNLYVPGREKDLDDVLDADDVLERAIWIFNFQINDNAEFNYNYTFNPPSLLKDIKKRHEDGNEYFQLTSPTKEERISRRAENRDHSLLKKSDLEGIGPIHGSFYVFSRDKKVLNAQGAYQSVKQYLDEQTGIRIYRDGIRVFNYGEPNEDWLGLNAGRINHPGKKIGTNMVIGGINLNLQYSKGLNEKTNREGFDENSTYLVFRWIITSLIEKFHILHRNDREELAKSIKGEQKKDISNGKNFDENIKSIRATIKKYGIEREVEGIINQIETDYIKMRDVTLSSGIAGINLAVIFHEVERGIDDLNIDIIKGVDYEILRKRSDHLAKLLEGFTPLIRRNEQKRFSVKSLSQRVIDFSQNRFEHHKVIISCPILTGESPDFYITGPFGLLQAALNNLVDNSIHWTGIKSENSPSTYQPAMCLLTLTDWFSEGPALVLLDNGPGFKISADDAIQPFHTTRPGGMGVGLYYADQVMQSIGGRLLISNSEELDLADTYNGAAVVLIFKKDNVK
jgi:hypothetical protein